MTTQISDLQTVEKIVKDKEREIEGIRLSRQHAIETVEGVIRDLKAKVQRLADYRCDATGASSCPFLTDAHEAKKTIPAREAELQRLTDAKDPREEKLLQELGDLRRKCAAVPALRKEAEQLLSTKRVLADEMQRAEERITALKDDLRPLLEAEQAEKELPELETQLAALEKEKEGYLLEADRAITAIEAEVRAREDEVARIVIDPTLKEAKEQIAQNLSALGTRIAGQRSEEAALRKEAGALDEALRRIAESEAKCIDLDKEIEHLKKRDLGMDHRGEGTRERRDHRPRDRRRGPGHREHRERAAPRLRFSLLGKAQHAGDDEGRQAQGRLRHPRI